MHPTIKRLSSYLWREWIRPLAIPLLLITAAKSALADINVVPSGSMQPTILIGDIVFVNKLAYDLKVPFTTFHVAEWSAPSRGAIVVCFAPDDGTRLVKRVVGLPGDTIELRQNQLIINGKQGEPGAPHSLQFLPERPALRDFGPIRVPAGHYFVMGDSRDNSRDSRYFGFVDRGLIVGEAEGVFVSADPSRYLMPRFGRFFSGLQ